jgi:hypothetical protein
MIIRVHYKGDVLTVKKFNFKTKKQLIVLTFSERRLLITLYPSKQKIAHLILVRQSSLAYTFVRSRNGFSQ